MEKPSSIQPAGMTKHTFFGVFGDPGIGKSRLVGTTPGQVLVIRPPQEHHDSWLPADKARARRGEIEVAVIEDWSGMDEILAYARAEGDKWNWIWYDNVSILFDVLLDDIWDTVIHEKPARARYGLDKQEYGINMDRLKRHFRHVVGPDNVNVGFTAHAAPVVSPDYDADGDPVEKLMPWIQGKGMPDAISGYMNVLAYYTKAKIGGKDGRRVLRTESSPTYYAKDQFDAFGGRVVDPTMPKIIKLIEESPGRSGTASTSTAKRPAKRRRTVTRRK